MTNILAFELTNPGNGGKSSILLARVFLGDSGLPAVNRLSDGMIHCDRTEVGRKRSIHANAARDERHSTDFAD